MEFLFDPPVLFFFAGWASVWFRSDLKIPDAVSSFLSIYLLFCIGFKGGVQLRAHGISPEGLSFLGLALLGSVLIPVVSFFVLRKKLGNVDAAAIAACYGSVSAVTFAIATEHAADLNWTTGPHTVVGMALMEAPAIVVSLMLLTRFEPDSSQMKRSKIILKSLTNSGVFLLIASFFVGWAANPSAVAALKPVTADLFKGALCFFLIDKGILAAQRFFEALKKGKAPFVFAILTPIVSLFLAIFGAYFLGLSNGDALILSMLLASASYIAAPAAIKLCLPQANPSLFVTLALGVTFPFNILVGLGLATAIINNLWGTK
jgi:hypothetical protein